MGNLNLWKPLSKTCNRGNHVFGDELGYFMETYQEKEFKEDGIDAAFFQDNQSKSKGGVLRGLHSNAQNHRESSSGLSGERSLMWQLI